MLLRLMIPVLLLALLAAAQEPSVRITWIGQSCFLVQNSDGSPAVITDPPDPSNGYPLPATPADVVTVSHNHTDHNYTRGVNGNFTLVDGRPVTARQEISAASMTFVLIPGFHDNQQGRSRGQSTIIRWTQGGVTFVHLGDFGQDQPTEAQLTDLQNIDVLFIPAGGFYTIDAQAAAALVKQLKPRVAIPMHFRTALGGPTQLATFPAAVSPFEGVVYKPAAVTVSRGGLPSSPEVWLMEVAADAVAVNGASFSAGIPVAPGSLATLAGNFKGSQTAAFSGYPMPRKLGETEVLVGGSPAPLHYVSPAQINFQVPRQLTSSQQTVDVRVGGQRVAHASVTVVPAAPGVFAAVGQDGRINAARRGQTLQIYATGQGDVAPVVEDGAAAAAIPLSTTPGMPEVYVGGKRAAVQFSGLAPGFAGLWQINAVIPPDAPTGAAVPVVVVQAFASNTLNVLIE